MRSIVSFVLGHHLLMALIGILLLGAGWQAYRALPVDAYPDVTPTLVQVFTETDGLAPEEVERFVTVPVERAMAGLPGLRELRTISNFGLAVINLYFEDGMDIYFARQLVNERLQAARKEIPESFGVPEMGPVSTGMGQVLFYQLEDTTGRQTPETLRTLQDWTAKLGFQSVPGVAEVLSLGGEVRQFHVNLRPEALLRHGVSVPEITAALRANNGNAGAQYLTFGNEEAVVRIVGLAERAEDLKAITVKTVRGVPIRLEQLADVTIGGEVRRGLATADGKGEAVVGMVLKLVGANTSHVIKGLRARLDEVNAALPEGVRVNVYYDQSALVARCIRTVTEALVIGMLLVAGVLFLFMGSFRSGLVAALAIPFSVLFAFLAMWLLDIGADLMSFGGLAIAIGMMVDASIVIAERVDGLLRERPDDSPRAIVLRAVEEVGRPILYAVAVIAMVFLPLFALQGVEGKTFRPLAEAVILGLLGSLLYALLFAPLLAYLTARRPKENAPREPLSTRLLLIPYRPLVRVAVKARWVTLLLAVALLGAGFWVYPRVGAEFMPRLEEGDLLIRATMAPSISLEGARDTMLRVERHLMERFPEVRRVVTRIGRGEIGAHADPVNSAEAFVALHPKAQWVTAKTPEALYAAIGHDLESFPGVTFNITQPIAAAMDELVSGTKADLAVKLFGPDMEVLRAGAERLASLLGRIPGAADVQVDQTLGTPQLRITPRRDVIARHGLSLEDIQSTLRTAIGGEEASIIFEGDRRTAIVVRLPPEARNDADAIGCIRLPAPDGSTRPLAELAEITMLVGPRQITRQDGQRFVAVQCNVRGRDIVGFVEEAKAAAARELRLPPGVTLRWGGQFELRQAANARFAVVIPLTFILVALMIFAGFREMRSMVLVLLALPLALVGGLIALWLSGHYLSVPASVGFIALFGVALEDAMVLVECINGLRKQGLTPRIAALRGAQQRLRPILMTTVTTALGMVPLLLSTGVGSEIQRPLATVVTGGLATSTLITLLLIPALYAWFAPKRDALMGREPSIHPQKHR